MQAVRCKQCGDTRWTIFEGSLEQLLESRCELCGGEFEPERRRPGHAEENPAAERRTKTSPPTT